ncbi:MAG: metallophosphatase [Saprospiraceae bacterium]|nr:metallophosphatase [Saprospiraceae bacterium]
MDRRQFIKNSAFTSLVVTSGAFPLYASALAPEIIKLTILHTNDVHSRIEPFPMDGSRNEGLGGAAKRAGLIKKIRSKESNVLLLDAGDVFQGTPYFNFFGGELEFKLMSAMGYDACTIGNHDFDAGIDGLERQLKHADFPLLISNYDFKDTCMNGKTKEYKIFKMGKLKIGVFGVGIELNGLVPKALFKDTIYKNPLSEAERVSGILKNDENCDFVICLSHLGYKYDNDKVSDVVLAKSSQFIDLIIGGHTHTFMKEPEKVLNSAGKIVIVNQVGWAGIMLGRLDVFFERNKKGSCVTCNNSLIS